MAAVAHRIVAAPFAYIGNYARALCVVVAHVFAYIGNYARALCVVVAHVFGFDASLSSVQFRAALLR